MGTKLNDIFPFFSDKTAKLVLTIFRLLAIVGIGYWLWDNIHKQTANLFRWALCLIFAGALGNIIDSVFYGMIFSHSYGQVLHSFQMVVVRPYISGACSGYVTISSCELELA